MRMKKIFSAVLALSVICGGIAPFAAELPEYTLAANAVDVVDSGKCGDNLIWEIDSEGILTISGTGDMYNYGETGNLPPFESKRIQSIVISEGITSIGMAAFFQCSELTSITIPESVTSIGYGAFDGCSSLSSVTIPDSVTSIEDGVFYYCLSLESVTIPDSVTSIGEYAFWECSSLESVTLPDSVTSIGDYAFSGCSSIKTITIPDSVINIGTDTFSRCTSLESVTIPDSVTSIEDYAFCECFSLESVTIPESVTSIGIESFGGTKWLDNETEKTPLFVINGLLIDGRKCSGDILIPDSVTCIEGAAFLACSSLESITIPDSVTSIGEYAFNGCSNLTSITVLNPECEIYDDSGTISAVIVNSGNDTYNGVIRGYDNSTAQAYAEKYNYKFESLGAAPTNTATESGDLNDDGKIDATDATLVLVNYSLLSTGEKMQLTESQQKAADVNGDGKIDASDATMILQYYSYLSTGGKDSFADFLKK